MLKIIAILHLIIVPLTWLTAQDNSLALATTTAVDSEQTTTSLQDYYKDLMSNYGRQYRYKAAAMTLNAYKDTKDEYAAKLINLLAEEATLQHNFDQARCYHKEVLETTFEAAPYSEGLVAEQEKLKALVGLRNIAMQDQEYKQAIGYHQRYVHLLKKDWPSLFENNRLRNDKVLATCYQHIDESEQAIACLTPYIFGNPSAIYSEIDKQAIDHLTDLLRTKYPKKEFRQFKRRVAQQIFAEERGGRFHFYLKVFENKIYLESRAAFFSQKIKNEEMILGQAIAYYQRKVLNSYFYQSLMR